MSAVRESAADVVEPGIDLIDETFIAAPPQQVAAAFADASAWPRWWPDLVLEIYRDRGREGLRWTVRGALVGTMEVWCEAMLDGTVVHYYLRATPTGPGARGHRQLRRDYQQRALATKRVVLDLKRSLEGGREPGTPPR